MVAIGVPATLAATRLAAALLFFFLAGAGQETRSNDTPRIEDAAQLLAPSALESLIPD